ncbi:MAG: LysR family transcriptional regulator [Clostridiales bacterium]|nr:LysR family transcriptional regulator [Clostridiales bacterium]
MEIREIQTFLLAARLESFSRAARELGYSQAAVTIQIRNLEKELDARLFDRIGRKTVLTHTGQIFYGHALTISRELSAAKSDIARKSELTGSLSLGAIDSVCTNIFPELLEAYHRSYPAVTIRIVPDSPAILLDELAKNSLDLVYLLDQRVYDPKFKKVIEEPEEMIFVTAASHPAAKRESLTLDEVISWPFILTEKNASYRFALDQYLTATGRSLKPFLETRNTELIVKLLKSGSAISFLPRFTVQQEIAAGNLVGLSVSDYHLRAWRQVLYHKDKWITREMTAFIQLAQAVRQE